jgi:hypothetical protein
MSKLLSALVGLSMVTSQVSMAADLPNSAAPAHAKLSYSPQGLPILTLGSPTNYNIQSVDNRYVASLSSVYLTFIRQVNANNQFENVYVLTYHLNTGGGYWGSSLVVFRIDLVDENMVVRTPDVLSPDGITLNTTQCWEHKGRDFRVPVKGYTKTDFDFANAPYKISNINIRWDPIYGLPTKPKMLKTLQTARPLGCLRRTQVDLSKGSRLSARIARCRYLEFRTGWPRRVGARQQPHKVQDALALGSGRFLPAINPTIAVKTATSG